MKALGVIPARIGSTRLPRKPLIDILGKSLIQRTYESSKASKEVQDIVVATDSIEIYNHVKKFGGEVVMTSDKHESGTSRVFEVFDSHKEYDIVVNIQGDHPLLKDMHIQV
jgi:3-deoxy-manno-octulosonate cytidylyltransferase (CMP-KDO synthetase)